MNKRLLAMSLTLAASISASACESDPTATETPSTTSKQLTIEDTANQVSAILLSRETGLILGLKD